MNARQQLNTNHFVGALLLAALGGSLFSSWLVFWAILIGLLWRLLAEGDVRLPSGR